MGEVLHDRKIVLNGLLPMKNGGKILFLFSPGVGAPETKALYNRSKIFNCNLVSFFPAPF